MSNPTFVTTSGSGYTDVPATTTGTAVLTRPGILCGIMFLSANATTAITLSDSVDGTGSPQAVFISPVTVAVGTFYSVQIPCANGIWAAGGTGSAHALVTYQ